jgi:hypothetical protein
MPDDGRGLRFLARRGIATLLAGWVGAATTDVEADDVLAVEADDVPSISVESIGSNENLFKKRRTAYYTIMFIQVTCKTIYLVQLYKSFSILSLLTVLEMFDPKRTVCSTTSLLLVMSDDAGAAGIEDQTSSLIEEKDWSRSIMIFCLIPSLPSHFSLTLHCMMTRYNKFPFEPFSAFITSFFHMWGSIGIELLRYYKNQLKEKLDTSQIK